MTGQIPPYGANFRRVSLAYSRDFANRLYALKQDPRWFIRSDKTSEKWTIFYLPDTATAAALRPSAPVSLRERAALYPHLAIAVSRPRDTFAEAMAMLLDGVSRGFYRIAPVPVPVIVHAPDCGLQGSGLGKHCTCQPAGTGNGGRR